MLLLVKSLSVFTNRVLNFIVSGVLNKLKGFDVYYWLVTLLGLAFLIPSNFVYSIPHNVNMVWGLFLIIMFIQWISAKSSKYVPNNLDEFLSIMIVSPGAEMILFQGIILSIFLKLKFLSHTLLILGIFKCSFSVILAAAIFSVIHVMPRHLNLIPFTIRIFILGLFYGSLTQTVGSFLLALVLHLAYNIFTCFYGWKYCMR